MFIVAHPKISFEACTILESKTWRSDIIYLVACTLQQQARGYDWNLMYVGPGCLHLCRQTRRVVKNCSQRGGLHQSHLQFKARFHFAPSLGCLTSHWLGQEGAPV